MDHNTEISDETLKAYIDGKLSRAEADMVADALVDSPPLAARLAELEVPISQLRPSFERMLDDMPPGTLPPSQTKAPTEKRGIVIAVALAFAAGIVVGLLLPR